MNVVSVLNKSVCLLKLEKLAWYSATSHAPILQHLVDIIEEAASNRCFPPSIILGMISRLSVDNNIISETGWRPCKLAKYW